MVMVCPFVLEKDYIALEGESNGFQTDLRGSKFSRGTCIPDAFAFYTDVLVGD